jgi:transcription initiation factor TFIID subunit 7
LSSLYYYYRLEVLDNVNPDLSDSEFIVQTPTPRGDLGDGENFEEPDENDEEDMGGNIDKELAAELNLALGADDVDERE